MLLHKRIWLGVLLATLTSSSFAEVSGTLEKDGEDLFFITEERIAYIKSPECQKFVSDNSTTYKVKFLGVDQDIKKTKLIGLTEIEFESGSRCKVNTIEKVHTVISHPVAAPAPPPPAMVIAPAVPISSSDYMSRQFTTTLADLPPVANSIRPSAAIFFRNSINAKKLNMALCKGFVQLETTEEMSNYYNVAIEEQVVTKVPVSQEIPQDTADCQQILAVYDYALAASELNKLHPSIAYSTGPFIVIYSPNSTRVDQVIDLRGYSEAQLEGFGQKWSSIFTNAANQYAQTQRSSSQQDTQFNIWIFVRDLFQASVCVTDPNLIYIFNESAGKIADIVCKGTKT
ncbi:hypothetical protein [Acinetobacter junii]|uniref:hypothetical protein n=1 Tax=Acinetobacter junii TaxID=40215 RepID=UPI00100F7EF7|nr:hypothetical protein [Acinetobacter junii]RXS93940.1 hypothetical protein ETZ13_10675 [Acinetobacter junii]